MSLLLMGAGLATDLTILERYWVGPTGNWDGTASLKWAPTSGGTGGLPLPTTSNPVYFDANSTALSVSLSSAACKGLDCTGFTGTIAGAVAMQNAGSMILNAIMGYSFSGNITFTSTSPGNVITPAGKSFGTLIYNGVGGSWQLQGDILHTGLQGQTITNGTLDLNGKTITGGGNFIASAAGSTVLSTGAIINLTNATSTTSIFDVRSGSYGTVNFTGGLNLSQPSIKNSAGDGALTLEGLSRTTSVYGILLIEVDLVISGLLTATGANANTQRACLLNDSPTALKSLVCNGTTSLTNADFVGQVVTGSAAPISGTSLGDFGGNSGITFDAAVDRWLVTAAGSNDFMGNIWAASGGGSPDGLRPLGQDTIKMDGNSFASGSRTLALSSYRIKNLDFTGATNTPAMGVAATPRIYGDLTLITAMTVSGTGNIRFSVRSGTQTITSAGRAFTCSLNITALGTVALGDDLNVTGTSIIYISGTLDDNDHNVTCLVFTFSLVASTTYNKGTGVYTLTGTGTVWNMTTASAALVTLVDLGTVKVTNNSASIKTFAGGGKTYNILWNATAGAGLLDISGSNTFAEIKSDASRSTRFQAGSTQNVNALTLGINCTLSSSSGASVQATINNTSGVAFAATGTTVTNINCTGAGLVVTTGVDGGGNTGVTFI